jgi:hypothetical protein
MGQTVSPNVDQLCFPSVDLTPNVAMFGNRVLKEVFKVK